MTQPRMKTSATSARNGLEEHPLGVAGVECTHSPQMREVKRNVSPNGAADNSQGREPLENVI